MLHIVFYARIGAEKGVFDMAGVLESINQKLIYRHPHVFGDVEVADAREVLENWETLKLKEKGRNHRVLEGVPTSMPALVKANRIQEKASGVGFDWERKEQVWEKSWRRYQSLPVKSRTSIPTGWKRSSEIFFRPGECVTPLRD